MLLFWRLLVVLCILLALIGLVLPILPTVPFLLVAAWGASRCWPQLEKRLLMHPVCGPPIVRWRERGAIPRKAKWMAIAGMAGSSVWVWLSPAPMWLQIAASLLMCCVGFWIWRRPDA